MLNREKYILYKIKLIIALILLVSPIANAQNKWNDSKTDTIYYNFYNDIQMIEIIYGFPPSWKAIEEYHRMASTMNSIPSPPNSYHFSVYIFRNRQGEIISVFNKKKEKIHQSDFIPVTELRGDNLSTHIPNEKKKAILDFHYNSPFFIRTWDYLDAVSSPKPLEFYTIYDLNSIPDKQLPQNFSKLTNEEHTLLTSSSKGMIDTLGNIVLTPDYNRILVYDSTLLLTKDEKYSFLNRKSRTLSIEYDHYKLLPTNPAVFAVESNDLWGFVNQSGELIVDFYYDNITYPFRGYSSKNQYIMVLKNHKLGLLDTNFNEIVPIEFSSINIYNLDKKEFFVLTKDEKTGVFNEQLDTIISMQYELITHSQGMNTFLVKENGNWGVIDLNGKVLFPTEYLIVGNGNTTYTIHKDNKYGIYDIYMNEIYPIELEGKMGYVYNFGENYSFGYIRKDGKMGIYDGNKIKVLAPKYDKIEFRPPYFYAYIGDKKYILDTDFKKVRR
ncbi:MAG TPA: WG repeat-containing protein [Brumimicrobium sp.]|nr:WG repeat-containing protein [Brumimicrobium sp.]